MNNESEHLLNLSKEIIQDKSSFLSSDDIRRLLNQQHFSHAVNALWGFTGHFYLWPKVLLARCDLLEPLRIALKTNLQDELEHNDTLPHRLLFANMAHSLSISLDEQTCPNRFMKKVLFNARNLSIPEAIGQFFANELMPKWEGFNEVFRGSNNCDMTFINVHCGALHNDHSYDLLNAIDVDSIPGFLKGIIDYSNMFSDFMGEIRTTTINSMSDKERMTFP